MGWDSYFPPRLLCLALQPQGKEYVMALALNHFDVIDSLRESDGMCLCTHTFEKIARGLLTPGSTSMVHEIKNS